MNPNPILELEIDDDGYPTEGALKQVREWDVVTPGGLETLFDGIVDAWAYPHFVRKQVDQGTIFYVISTGGWSGNESLIEALQQNNLAWALTWAASFRGGHYHFTIRKIEP